MQALRKAAPILIATAIAFVMSACQRTDMPTEPLSPTASAPSNLFGFTPSTVIWVNDGAATHNPPGTSCENPGYPTIQSAVLAATPGDRINVCPGTYIEQVIILATKDNIVLRSVRPWQAIIKAPPGMIPGPTAAIVNVSGAHNVSILGFTITGPGPAQCIIEAGVRVAETGSAFILGNHITDIRDEPLGGCQNGVAVLVGGRASSPGVGSAWIVGNLIDHYQKNGPTVNGLGSTAVIAYNRVIGAGPTDVTAQNGIQVGVQATASVASNFVAQNIYTGLANASSSGILLFASGKTGIDHNTVTSNDVNIWMYQAAATSRSADNRSSSAKYDGVAVDGSIGNQVAHNWIDQNSGPGVGVYDAAGNNVSDNRVESNDDSGILLDGAASNTNTIARNSVRNNGTESGDKTDGIRANPGAVGNTIRDNRLRNNITHDCHDENVTGNAWINNTAQTSYPRGLCRRGDGGSDSERASAFGWNASFPWYSVFGLPTDPGAAGAVDTQSLLQAPTTRTGAARGAVSPAQ